MTDSAANQPEEITAEPTVEAAMPDSSAAEAAANETEAIAGSVTAPEDAGEAAAKAEAEATALKNLPRPRWSFSGKRGRPVHERDAVNKLPAEVRDVVNQFVRTVQEDKPASKFQMPSAKQPSPEATETPAQAPDWSTPAPAAEPTVAASTAAADAAPVPAAVEAPPVAAIAFDGPDPSAGIDELRLASTLIGRAPVTVIAVEPAPEPEPVVETIAHAEPEASELELELERELANLTIEAEAEIEPEPELEPTPQIELATPTLAVEVEAEVEPAAAPPTEPAVARAPRPRSRSGATKRRRNSLAWEKQPSRANQLKPTSVAETVDAPAVAKQAPVATPAAKRRRKPAAQQSAPKPQPARVPEAILHLSSPLQVERTKSNGFIEPRVTRRRSIARRAELDSALAELSTFVESTGARR